MTINETNMLRRWKTMAKSDLGSLVQPVAIDLENFFSHMIEKNYMNNVPETVLRLLRGFEINANWLDTEDCYITDTYDLNTVKMSKYGIDEFDSFLMNDLNWISRYQYALENK